MKTVARDFNIPFSINKTEVQPENRGLEQSDLIGTCRTLLPANSSMRMLLKFTWNIFLDFTLIHETSLG